MQLYRKKRLREERVFNIIVVFQSDPFEVEKKKDNALECVIVIDKFDQLFVLFSQKMKRKK